MPMSMSRQPILMLPGLLVVWVTTATPLPAAAPSVTGLFPPVVQAGQAATITVSGKDLGTITRLVTARGELETRSVNKTAVGIRVSQDSRPPGRFPELIDTWTLTSTGLSNPRAVLVVTHPVVVVAETPDEQVTPIPLPGTAASRLDRTADRDVFSFTGRSGQLVHLVCRSRSLDGTVSPILTVHDPEGRELIHSRSHEAEPELALQLPTDGPYQVTVVDRGFQHDEGSIYALTLETGPRLHATAPTAVSADTGQLLLLGHELPGGTVLPTTGLSSLKITPDQQHGQWSWPDRRPVGVLDDGFRVRLPGCSGTPWVNRSHTPIVAETINQNDTASNAQVITPPARICGVFERSADIDWFAIDAKKGQTLEITGWGERLGQSMRLQAIVHDKTGKTLATIGSPVAPKKIGFDFPFSTNDPHANWTAPADGRFTIVVRDLLGGSIFGSERVYQLVIGPPRKRFRAFSVVGDGKTHSGLSLAAGGQATLQIVVVRMGGSKSPIEISAADLPEGVTVETTSIPADKPVTTITLKATPAATTGVAPIRILAKHPGDQPVVDVLPLVHPVGPAPTSRTADALLLSVTPPAKKTPTPKK